MIKKLKRTPETAVLATILSAIVLCPIQARAQNPTDILIIVNKSSKIKQISMDELRDIFLLKRNSWKNGGKVIPIHNREGSESRAAFRKRILNMSSSQEKTYWQERKIKAGVTAPVDFGNTQKAVFKLKGAVSYVYRSQFKEGATKIIMVVPAP